MAVVLGALLASAAIWAAGAPAQAGDPPQTPNGSQASSHPAKIDPKDVITCRDIPVTGSHIDSKRVCHTKREWDELAAQTQQILDDPNGHILKGPQSPW